MNAVDITGAYNTGVESGRATASFPVMTKLEIPVDEKWMASAGMDPASTAAEFRLLLAVKLFELQRMSLGQAAEMAGLSLWEFDAALSKLRVSPMNLSSADLADDLARA